MLRAFIFGAIGAVMVVGSALADGPVNKTWLGNAIDGYDVVAYHLGTGPLEGRDDITYDWMDATWWFANEANRDLFVADPKKYAPAYGGYCAYGVTQGVKVGFEPEAWKIVDDVLYLNLNKDVQRRWVKDIPGYIERADEIWPTLRDE